MLPGEDLAGLFRPPDQVENFRQGVVLAFDPNTGASQIDVGGVVLSNLPLLNIGDTVNLAPGNVVVLMRVNGSWAILGRVVTPNSAVLNSTAVGFGGTNPAALGTGFTVTNTAAATKCSGTIPVPAWANRASVIATMTTNVKNNGAAGFMYNRLVIDGLPGATPYFQVGAAAYAFCAAHATRNDAPVTPGGSILIEGQVWAAATMGAGDAANLVQVDSFAVFRKV
jgi:hypothetical protein